MNEEERPAPGTDPPAAPGPGPPARGAPPATILAELPLLPGLRPSDVQEVLMKALIELAIRSRRMIAFDYGGFRRIAEPHVLGHHDGLEQVLAWQTEGGSASGRLPEWRRFDIRSISGLTILERSFPGRRPVIQGRVGAWDQLYRRVD